LKEGGPAVGPSLGPATLLLIKAAMQRILATPFKQGSGPFAAQDSRTMPELGSKNPCRLFEDDVL
jgi:hypothetical protein